MNNRSSVTDDKQKHELLTIWNCLFCNLKSQAGGEEDRNGQQTNKKRKERQTENTHYVKVCLTLFKRSKYFLNLKIYVIGH